MYVILKHIEVQPGVTAPVILIDGQNEILEFNTEDEAEKLRALFESNSTHSYKYEVKKV